MHGSNTFEKGESSLCFASYADTHCHFPLGCLPSAQAAPSGRPWSVPCLVPWNTLFFSFLASEAHCLSRFTFPSQLRCVNEIFFNSYFQASVGDMNRFLAECSQIPKCLQGPFSPGTESEEWVVQGSGILTGVLALLFWGRLCDYVLLLLSPVLRSSFLLLTGLWYHFPGGHVHSIHAAPVLRSSK